MFVIIFIFLIFITPLNAQDVNNFSIPEEIIVKSTRSETNIYQLGGSVDIITSEQIKKSGFQMAAICEGIYSDKSEIKERSRQLLEIWNEN